MFRSTHDYLKYSIWCDKEYQEAIEWQIKKSEILIIGLSWCPWTMRAKSLVKENYGLQPRVLPVDIRSNRDKVNYLYCMSKLVNTVYVPQVWIEGKHIGGFEELYKMHHRGQINIQNNNNKGRIVV